MKDKNTKESKLKNIRINELEDNNNVYDITGNTNIWRVHETYEGTGNNTLWEEILLKGKKKDTK
jgi:hypothetical protein